MDHSESAQENSMIGRRIGAYRLEEASAIGLLLVAIAFALAYAASGWSDARR